MSRVFRFATGLLAGMAFGALLALIFAPSTGSDLRAQLEERVLLGKRASETRRQELLLQLEQARRG